MNAERPVTEAELSLQARLIALNAALDIGRIAQTPAQSAWAQRAAAVTLQGQGVALESVRALVAVLPRL